MTHAPGNRGFRVLRAAAGGAIGRVLSAIRGAGFWTAILLPVLYVPMVLLGNSWMVDLVNFSKVVALHVVFLFVGRGHGSDAEPRVGGRSAVSTSEEAAEGDDDMAPSRSTAERGGEDVTPIPAR